MSSSRLTLIAIVSGITLLALAVGRYSGPPETFNFDQWEQERKAKAPLIERTRVAGEADPRPVGEPGVAKELDKSLERLDRSLSPKP